MRKLAVLLTALACGRQRMPSTREDAARQLGPACLERPKADGWLLLYCGAADPGGDVLIEPCENPCGQQTLRLRFDGAGRFAGVQNQ